MSSLLTIAMPKGRLLKRVSSLLEKADIPTPFPLEDERQLIVEFGGLRYAVIRPFDLPTYVEYGAADLGFVGKDVLLETQANVYEPLDLQIGRCRLVIAGKEGMDPFRGATRVVTKYPKLTQQTFSRHGVSVEIIKLHGSVELAPLVGLADRVVDLVESGATLERQQLTILADIAPISTRLVVNRVSYKMKHEQINSLLQRIEKAIQQ